MFWFSQFQLLIKETERDHMFGLLKTVCSYKKSLVQSSDFLLGCFVRIMSVSNVTERDVWLLTVYVSNVCLLFQRMKKGFQELPLFNLQLVS